MATLPALYPEGDGTINTAVVTRSSGAGTYFSHIDEDPSTGMPDASYLFNAGATGGDSHFDIGAIPSDFGSMSTLTVDTYTAVVGRVDDNITLRVSVMAADETTRLAGDTGGTQGAAVSGADNPSGYHQTTLTLTSAGLAASKADWDGARIRLNWVYSQSMSKDAYDLRVHALRLNGTYTIAATPPAQVTGLTAVPASTTSIDLAWDTVADATSYEVQQRIGALGSWSTIATPTGTTHTATSLSVPQVASYHFQVRAFNGAVSGPYSSAIRQMPYAPTLIEDFVDTFDTLDDPPWIYQDAIINPQIVSGKLRLTPHVNYGLVETHIGWDLRESELLFQIVEFPLAGANEGDRADVEFFIRHPSGSNPTSIIRIRSDRDAGGAPTVRGSIAGGGSSTISWTDETWFRFRHTGTTLFFESSADGTSWTTIHSGTSTNLHCVSVGVLTGYDGSIDTGGPQYALFDNLNNPPTPSGSQGRFKTSDGVSKAVKIFPGAVAKPVKFYNGSVWTTLP